VQRKLSPSEDRKLSGTSSTTVDHLARIPVNEMPRSVREAFDPLFHEAGALQAETRHVSTCLRQASLCIKQWMYQGAFLMRGLTNVRAEFSLTALAYNLRRALNILGVEAMTAAVVAIKAVRLIRADWRSRCRQVASDGQWGESG
jgi:hypothetical protein